MTTLNNSNLFTKRKDILKMRTFKFTWKDNNKIWKNEKIYKGTDEIDAFKQLLEYLDDLYGTDGNTDTDGTALFYSPTNFEHGTDKPIIYAWDITCAEIYRYEVDYYDYNNGATSAIDTVIIDDPEYTADDYTADVIDNADDDYKDLLKHGYFIVERIDD